jgi:hypothetical protein
MRLTSEQTRELRQRLPVGRCPTCGNETLDVSDHVIVVPGPMVKPGLPRPDRGRIALICQGCGYIMEFDAAMLGIPLQPR